MATVQFSHGSETDNMKSKKKEEDSNEGGEIAEYTMIVIER